VSDYALSLNETGGEAPTGVQLAPGQQVRVYSITAEWDGSGASGPFHPACSIYSPDGVLVTRTRPEQVFAAGDSGVVTYAPFLHSEAEVAPTGGFVAYRKRVDDVPTPGDSTDELWIVPFAGGAPTMLTSIVNESISQMVVSPDGSSVAYVQGTFLTNALRLIGTDGSGDVELEPSVGRPCWAPDGSGLLVTKSGVGLGIVTTGGAFTALGIVGDVGQFTFTGDEIAYWNYATDKLRVCNADGTNDRLLDGAAPVTAQAQQLSTGRVSLIVGYGYAVVATDYYRIFTDGTGRTVVNPPGYNAGSNPIVRHDAWAPDDSFYVSAKFEPGPSGWEVTKFFADGTTAPAPLGFITSGNTGQLPYLFGDRIYFVNGRTSRGKPLVSVALDGSDLRTEDDCNGGSLDCQLTME
jgi:dipeptidyl aminopeptidase/acylaminoacyl peptidase